MNNLRLLTKNRISLFIGLILTPGLSFGMEQERKQEDGQPKPDHLVEHENNEDTSFGNYFDNMIETWASEPLRPKKAEKPAIKEYVPYVKPGQRLRIMLVFAKSEDERALFPWQTQQVEAAATAAAIQCYEQLLRENQS